ncbi:MAG: hypothetical protein R3242_04665 [Akkermansiaceae bacterium]|nr:hypothetical protein [Akkermansiaceae bacterium]
MSTATTDAQLETPPDPIERLNDFSDRLSPIVVKEMRQGLRQASFVVLFLFLQSVLAMAVISALIAVSDGSAASRSSAGYTITAFFFSIFGIAALLIQPLRGLNALSSEIKDSTIDLLLLTRLNAWRIVLGKWMSLVTQSALLLVAVIPYLMMRYFLGGMNLVGELTGLLFVFLVGATVTAAAVGMSAIRSLILRGIFAIAAIILFIITLQGSVGFYVMGRGFGLAGSPFGTAGDWLPLLIGTLLLLAFLTHAFLEFGATRIAAPSENRSARKRLIALISLLVIPTVMAMSDVDMNPFGCITIAIILPIVLIDCLSESPGYISSGRRRESWLMRPGWPSGALFGLILVSLAYVWLIVHHLFNRDSFALMSYNGAMGLEMIHFVAVFAMIFTQPVLFIALFKPLEREPAPTYLIALLGSTCLSVAVLAIASSMRDGDYLISTLFWIFPILGFGSIDQTDITLIMVMALLSMIHLGAAAMLGRFKWGGSMRVPASPITPGKVENTATQANPEPPEVPADKEEA